MSSTPQKIGHGAVGCVYRPAIPCKDGTVPAGYVSKLVKKSSLAAEYNKDILEKLKEIDPQETYVIRPVKPEEICQGQQKEANISKETIDSCPPFLEQSFRGLPAVTKNTAAVLYQKNAGPTTLADILKADYTKRFNPETKRFIPSQDFLDLLQKAIQIEEFLLQKGLTHADISLQNIMVLPDKSVRFIDVAGIQKLETHARTTFFENIQKSLEHQETLLFSQLSRSFPSTSATPPSASSTPLNENATENENAEYSGRPVLSLGSPGSAGSNTPTSALSLYNKNSFPTKKPIIFVGGKRRKTRGQKGQKKRKRNTKKVRRTK